MGFTRLGGPWTCWVGLGDPPPVGGVGWCGDPLDSPSARPSEGPTEGRNEGPRGATSQLRLGHRGERFANCWDTGGRAAQIGPWFANCSGLVKVASV